ncbi:MAG: hypothetical protein OES84_02735, partial [Kiritimatiellaceae bacterium]|nr:hypothetical protein [Kiritimatiellaceae bacterium]
GDAGVTNTFTVQVDTIDGSDTATLNIFVAPAPPVEPPVVVMNSQGSSGTGVTLSWTGAEGVAYGVQTNSDLVDGTWDSYITNLIGNGGQTITFTNDIDAGKLFFRVIAE